MKKKHPEHVNLERWLVSYADFITLLFAFFVVMYAISQADKAKLEAVSKSIRDAFGNAGPVGMIDLGGNAGGDKVQELDIDMLPGGRAINLPAGKTHTAADPDPEIQGLKELLEESISLSLGAADAQSDVRMEFDSQGLVIRLAVVGLYDAGAVEVEPDLRPLLERIGKILQSTDRLVRVEGHTDLSEGGGSRYSNGWELSSARAAWIVQYWVQRFGFKPAQLGAAGYSYFRPVSGKKTDRGQATNRRVEIVILNTKFEQ